MGYLSDSLINRLRKTGNLGYYLQLKMDLESDTVRLWSGPSDIMQTMTGVDAAPALYKGVRFNELREFDVIMNGGAIRGEFFIEGVSADSADKIAGLDPAVAGKQFFMGLAAHDDALQPVGNIVVMQRGRSDFWHMEQPVIAGEGAATRTLALSVGFGETGRSRPRRSSYTDPQQQWLWPGDTFCRDVARYHRGYVVSWPRFFLPWLFLPVVMGWFGQGFI